MKFVVNDKEVGSAFMTILSDGTLNTEGVEMEFYAAIRKNSKAWLKEAEEDERDRIISNLTHEQEEKLKEEHAKDYHGTDDDMPDAYESWLEDLDLTDYKRILNL